MVYILYISLLHNKTKDRYIYGPQEIDIKYNNIKYWVLPDYTNSQNFMDVMNELVNGLFEIDKKISIGRGYSNLYTIRDISWDGKIKKTYIKTGVKSIDNDDNVRKFKTKIYIYLKKNDKDKETFKDECKYHKTFLKDIFSNGKYFNQFNYKNMNKNYMKKVYTYLIKKKTLDKKQKEILRHINKVLTYKEKQELL